jgi:hypothetical protein
MTVSSSTNRVSYAGNGSTTVFPYTYKIFDQDDLTVILRAANGTETVQTITSQYTVSGVGNAGGGNVTMLTAPASGATLVILREQDLIQELDIVPNDPFPADSLEGALDKLTFMVQQHEETLGPYHQGVAHEHDRWLGVYDLCRRSRQQGVCFRRIWRCQHHAGHRHLSRQLVCLDRVQRARHRQGHLDQQHLYRQHRSHIERFAADHDEHRQRQVGFAGGCCVCHNLCHQRCQQRVGCCHV